MNHAIIMAAGKGTRMKSSLPKVAHKVCGKSMVELILDQLDKSNIKDRVVVLGYGIDIIKPIIKDRCIISEQKEQ